MPESITRMTRSERCRPSQAMRGSACRLVRPSASTTPGIVDTALAKPASSAIAACCRAPRCAIAERIGEMPDIARNAASATALSHRHFAQRGRILQVDSTG